VAGSSLNSDLTRLVEEHHEVLYRYAFRLTGAVADAEDLTQQTFLLAQQKLDQLRQAENARGWLFAILRNCYLKGFRKQTPLSAASLDLDMNSIPAVASDLPLDAEELQLALDELSAEFKLVLMLFYFEERSYREMAALLDVPVGTIMSRLSRAKACLRRRLFDPRQHPVSTANGPAENGRTVSEITASGLVGNGLIGNGPVERAPAERVPREKGPPELERSARPPGTR
jgi:RNA polymerase sigma-70 factor, ECF subfamily